MKRGMPSGAQTPDGIIFLLALIFSKAPPRYPPHHGAHWAYTNDIDIFVEKKDYQNFIEIMKANDFYEIKMEYTTLNHTVWEDAKNRIVDLHCFEYTGEGKILYEGDCFPVETFSGKGKIEEIEVSCIEPYSQVMFHLGYEFDENDVHDVKLLCKTFHIEIPNEYSAIL